MSEEDEAAASEYAWKKWTEQELPIHHEKVVETYANEIEICKDDFLAGIEHERKRLLGEGKPDKWAFVRFGKVGAVFDTQREAQAFANQYGSQCELAPGVEIKPVKLVVLDDSEPVDKN